ncbi:hypothetical protein TRFO_15531 [Tritrichomonas foetus]|uniref:ATPase domain-containing protein n=1 Tax=Tritrichomonas foetus TaxID=1144522 RepID=A0A1J4KSY7_9EUKA|nr:hypothetical protein TRFO_15531 [Tritrichomonas foetus]|eukprot:OHT14226.1 hypothetical protein TRFO_15531 [Tritrichomonas foetus]
MQNSRIFIIFSGVVLLSAGIISYFLQPVPEKIDRFEGPIPFIYTSSINKTVRHYIETRPSRFVLLIGGPSNSGKSRLIDILAQESIENSRLVIKLDVNAASSIEEFAKFLKVALVEGLTNIRSSISANKIKNVNNEIDMAEESQQTVSDPKIAKLFNILERNIDLSYQKGFSEKHIHRFFEILEAMSDNFRPIIFMHNFDKIASLGTDEDPEFGSKLIKSVSAGLSRRDLYQQTVPIVLEIKNTLYLVNKTQNPIFRYFEIDHELGDVTNELVDNAPVFNLFELRKVIKKFGAHGGSISKIFESLRYGQKIDDAIDELYQSYKVMVKSNIAGRKEALAVVKRICDAKGTLPIGNLTDIEYIRPLFDGCVYLSKEFQIRASNRAVVDALCSIDA